MAESKWPFYGRAVDVLAWLLAGDPAIRWQALRDLAGGPPGEVAAQRARVRTEGWGARLLAARDQDGRWAGGAHFPAAGWSREQGQPWTATSHSLTLLRLFGLDPDADVSRETVALIRANARWEHEGEPYWDGEVEPCINGQLVANASYFGVDVDGVVRRLLGDLLPDGGWNCYVEYGATRTSFASTINVLEGLLAHERAGRAWPASVAARRSGEEYLLERRLFRRKSTGAVVDEDWRQFSFPPYWHYDVLRALDYFRAVGDPPDARLEEAVELLRSKRSSDGTWPLENTHDGAVHFALEDGDGAPSRWNTLRALRVLDWYAGG